MKEIFEIDRLSNFTLDELQTHKEEALTYYQKVRAVLRFREQVEKEFEED